MELKMKVVFVLICVSICGGVNNPLENLPDFIRLPFEGSGQPTQQVQENPIVSDVPEMDKTREEAKKRRENQAEQKEWKTEGNGKPMILEVEGACDGYATGEAWITCSGKEVTPFSTILGAGHGADGMASTDSRPSLRYAIQPA